MFVEGLDFVLMALIDALEPGDAPSRELLAQITGDRGDMMERIRERYLAEEASVAPADRVVLFQVTSVFERIIWMTQRLSRLLAEPGGARLSASAREADVAADSFAVGAGVSVADSKYRM
jgi:hypothetical protein